MPSLHEVRFNPVHIMGIIHLRWNGQGAFGTIRRPRPPSPLTNPIWQNLQTLDLQLLNPFIPVSPVTPSQALMFWKLSYDYLRSFTPTLRILRLVWLDADGPSPMTLHLEDDLVGTREPLRWQALEELWVGNITFTNRTVQLADYLAPGLRKLMVLRSTYRNSRLDYAEGKAWMDRTPPKQSRDVMQLPLAPVAADDASSIYSRSPDSSETDLGGVSRTSRDVLCMLDMTGIPPEMQRRMQKRRQIDSSVLGPR